jgi:hypothetical protein
MRGVARLGVTVVAVLTISAAMGASIASARSKVQLVEEGHIVSTGTEVTLDPDERGFELVTTAGTFYCVDFLSGTLAANDAKTLPITYGAHDVEFECFHGPVVFESLGGVYITSLDAKGDASVGVTLPVPWPTPYEDCVYTGKSTKVRFTFAPQQLAIVVGLSAGGKAIKLKGKGCPQKKAAVELAFGLLGPHSPLFAEAL